MSKGILITGGSGMLGSHLSAKLKAQDYHVAHLGRNPSERNGIRTWKWDLEKGYIEEGALEGIDVLIHLAGAGIADHRWTKKRKAEILNSRVNGAKLIFDSVCDSTHNISTFISSSAIGYYGLDTGDDLMQENSPAGTNFLAKVCVQWEEAASQFRDLDIRTIILRTGVILGNKGGVLEKIADPIRFGVGAPLGTGEQFISWIHIDDLCGIIIKAIEDQRMEGIFNGVGPQPVTSEEFTKLVASALDKPLFLPNVPAFALKLLMGEMASIALGGNKVSSKKIEEVGYRFQHNTAETAIQDLLKT